MSGICAVWRRDQPERVRRALALASSGLSFDFSTRVLRESDPAAGVAVAARFDTQQIYRNERVLLACDVDLYNESELAGEIADSQPLPESAKTAALLAGLYERFGNDFVIKLRGAFALVLWDWSQRQLLAATDGFGIKRLVYFESSQALLVASRIDAIVRSGEVDPDINPRAIANVLNYSANLGPETIFSGVRRLPPGTVLLGGDGGVRALRYWDMSYGQSQEFSEERLSQELETVVEQSVAAHCKQNSFAEIGAFLSGGTDSSTIVGMMRRMQRGPVKAFSIGFHEQPFNELGYAEIAARKFAADHYTYLVSPDDCLAALPSIVRSFDEPYANSSAIPTYFCAALAAGQGVRTLLAGDGGDELFAGNEWYLADKIYQVYHSAPRWLRKRLLEPLVMWLPPRGLARRARRYIRRANLPPAERVLSHQPLLAYPAADIFQADFFLNLAEYSIVEIPSRHYWQAAARDDLDRLLYMDLKITLADNDLPKVTCMTELAGVQARFPFLDRSVAEFSGRIPARLKLKGSQKRYLFKRAFRELLPKEIIQKQKHGFGIPVSTWLKSHRRTREMARDTLLSTRARERGYFRREFIEELMRKHDAEDSTYYGDTLWTFLMVELWHRQFVDQPVGVTS
jgi:asparagine synthase (glutamine-hydrolysing)